MPAVNDLTGEKFGRLTVTEFSHSNERWQRFWICSCECGKTKVVRTADLTSGAQKSCGCFRAERIGRASRTHGLRHTPEYEAWVALRARCYNPNNPGYENYGGRGITVCERWRDSFESFLADMGPRPSPQHSIDREDNDKGYGPDNCRWVTRGDQNSNRRTVNKITYNGRTETMKEWARISGVKYHTLRQRLNLGWPMEKALNPEIDGRLV